MIDFPMKSLRAKIQATTIAGINPKRVDDIPTMIEILMAEATLRSVIYLSS
jgi:hypothetical protein